MVALQGVEDQRFVSFGDLEIGESTAVSQVELGHYGLHTQARELGVHFDVDGLVGLNPDDEFVAGNVLEDAGCDISELDADFGFLLIKGLNMSMKNGHITISIS